MTSKSRIGLFSTLCLSLSPARIANAYNSILSINMQAIPMTSQVLFRYHRCRLEMSFMSVFFEECCGKRPILSPGHLFYGLTLGFTNVDASRSLRISCSFLSLSRVFTAILWQVLISYFLPPVRTKHSKVGQRKREMYRSKHFPGLL